MERTLLLIRHAKADDGAVDVKRPLSRRGERDAAAVGMWLTRVGLVPARVVVSPAVRARQTWLAAAAQLPADAAEVVVDARVYDNDVDRLLAIVRETDADVEALALVGHNPSMHALASRLDDGSGDPELRTALADGFPTSAVAAFAVGDWAEVGAEAGRLVAFGVGRA